MPIHFDMRLAIRFAQQECVRDLERRVALVRIPAPCQVSQPASVRGVLAAVRRLRLECLAYVIRNDDDPAAGPAVPRGCGERGAHGRLVGRIHDRVVDEDDIEAA